MSVLAQVWSDIAATRNPPGVMRFMLVLSILRKSIGPLDWAKQYLRQIRDELAPALDGIDRTPKQIDDWLIINYLIDDEDASVHWFTNAVTDPSQEAIILETKNRLEPPLVARKMWRYVAYLYPDPLATLEKYSGRHASSDAGWHYFFRSTPMRLYAAMLAAGRLVEADQVAIRSFQIDPNPALRVDLIQVAIDLNLIQPCHRDWLLTVEAHLEPEMADTLRQVKRHLCPN